MLRSAGCIINDFADRDFDPFVSRTRERPLAARRLSPYEALGLCPEGGAAKFVADGDNTYGGRYVTNPSDSSQFAAPDFRRVPSTFTAVTV